MLTVYLIRHARSLANASHCWTGQRDIPLSAEGRAEQRKLCGNFAYPEADVYFSSPLSRCTQSFDIIYGPRPCMTLPSLMECSLGVLEGRKYTNLDDDPAYAAWLLVRLQRGGRASAAGVMHGNVMRAILHRFADPAVPHDAWKIPNGGMYALSFDGALKCSKWSTAPKNLFH